MRIGGRLVKFVTVTGATLLLYVSFLAICLSAFFFILRGLSNTRRFAFVRVGEVFSVVIGVIILTVVIGVEWMLSGVNEFFNRFVKILIVLSDVLCLLLLALKA